MMNPAIRYCLFVLMISPSSMTFTQTMNDLGMMGGSGMVFTPTIAVTPESHFRLDMTRLVLLQSGAASMNSFGMTSGLSSNMEFTAKFQSVLAGTTFSPSFVGFGGKIVLPFDFPLISRCAIWAEVVSNTNENTELFFPSKITRGALVIQPELLRQINGNILFGVSDVDHTRRIVAGCNASQIVGEWLKVGGEYLYNYYGVTDQQESILLLLRALPNVCVQLSPGYLHSPAASSWMISLGLSVSTAGIEFIRSEKSKDKKDEIPSIDELEKQLRDENKKDKEK